MRLSAFGRRSLARIQAAVMAAVQPAEMVLGTGDFPAGHAVAAVMVETGDDPATTHTAGRPHPAAHQAHVVAEPHLVGLRAASTPPSRN